MMSGLRSRAHLIMRMINEEIEDPAASPVGCSSSSSSPLLVPSSRLPVASMNSSGGVSFIRGGGGPLGPGACRSGSVGDMSFIRGGGGPLGPGACRSGKVRSTVVEVMD